MKSGFVKPLVVALIPLAVSAASIVCGLEQKQVVTVAAVSLMLTGIALYWEYKIPFASLGLLLLFLLGSLDIRAFVKSSHIDIVVFLACMMIVVEYLERTAFFEHLVSILVGRVCRGAYSLVAVFFIMTALFAPLVGVVTATLFMVPMIMDIALRYGVNPVPFVLMMTFAANIGSSATLVGSPVSILIAFEAHLTFLDFLRWATPAAVVSLLACLALTFIVFGNEVLALHRAIVESPEKLMQREVVSRAELARAWLIFLGVIATIALHGTIESLLNLEEGNVLLAAAIGGATVVLFLKREEVEDMVSRGVEWGVLLFFLFLFSSAGALEHVGLMDMVAEAIATLSQGDVLTALITLSVMTAGLSAILDNVLTVAFFIPVVKNLGNLGMNVYPLWWALLFSGTYVGNLTVIASTANIVSVGILEARKAGKISFATWIKYGLPFTMVPLTLALLLLLLRSRLLF